MKKRVCFIAQFPPPIHGLSKAVDTLYNSEVSQMFDFEKVDIKNNKKILHSIYAILRSRADLFYFTISQSKGGNLRDLLILWLLRKKKVLIHLHGGYYRKMVDKDLPKWQKKANYRAIEKLAGAIVLGPSLRSIFEGMLLDKKIFTVANCIDDEFMMSDTEFAKKMEELPYRQVKHVLYLSNFINSKGYPQMLEMARLEKQRIEQGGGRQFHFDFAGKFFEKAEEEYFWSFVREYGLEEYITYHGIVDGDRKRELLKLCDVFVLLTNYPKEGQPISILEAMGNGLSGITTDHAGIPDLVADKINGFVVSKDDSQQAQKGYDYLLNGIDDQVFFCNRQKVKTNYTQTKYLQNMTAIFQHLE